MEIQGQVGSITTTSSISQGTKPTVRLDNMGALVTTPLHGKYYETAYRRNLFHAANQAVTATTAALATTYTGIVLSNPVGSQVNLVLLKAGYGFLVAQPTAGSIVGLMCGYNSTTNVTHSSVITPQSAFVGVGASPVGLVDAGATLPTAPTVRTIFGSVLTGAITVSTTNPLTNIDLEGSVILPPGAYAAIYTSAASAASSFLGSFTWEEVPI